MLKDLSIKRKLLFMGIFPFVIMLCLTLMFMFVSNQIANNMGKVLYNESFLATQLLLNADRDYHQALLALQKISFTSAKKDLIDDFNENVDQVNERSNKSATILNSDTERWEKYTSKNKKTIYEEFKLFTAEFDKWQEVANEVINKKKTFDEQTVFFDSTREHLNTITELLERGSEDQIKAINSEKIATFIFVAILNLVSFLVALIISFKIIASIVNPVKEITDISLQLAENNFVVNITDDNSKTEIGDLNRSFKKFITNLRILITQVTKSVEDISASSEEMFASADQTAQGSQQTAISTTQLAQGAQEISRNVEQGATNINKLNKTIQQISGEANAISQIGNETETSANEGSQQVKKAVLKIDSIKKVSGEISLTIAELGTLSKEIETIVDLIKTIAGQTNLLALNAAIEAARAGEHGKGFAVVADEVKKLAEQSANATDKITSMIKDIQSKTDIAVSTMDKTTQEVEEGVQVINDAGNLLEDIIAKVKITNEKIQGITKEIEGTAQNSNDVVKMIENVSAVTEQTAASAQEISSITEEQTASLEEISASSQTLAKISEELNKQVSIFKV